VIAAYVLDLFWMAGDQQREVDGISAKPRGQSPPLNQSAHALPRRSTFSRPS
jgi:hypothetical protein